MGNSMQGRQDRLPRGAAGRLELGEIGREMALDRHHDARVTLATGADQQREDTQRGRKVGSGIFDRVEVLERHAIAERCWCRNSRTIARGAVSGCFDRLQRLVAGASCNGAKSRRNGSAHA